MPKITKADLEARAKELGFTAALTPTLRAAIWANMLEERDLDALEALETLERATSTTTAAAAPRS